MINYVVHWLLALNQSYNLWG